MKSRQSRSIWVRTVAAVLVPVLAGCYTIGPSEGGMPGPGARVVATLNAEGSQSVAERFGVGVNEMEGVVETASESSLTIGVTRVGQATGASRFVEREMIVLPRAGVQAIQQKRLNSGRSILAAALIVGAALLVAQSFGGIFGGDEPGDGPPVPPN